MKPFSPVRRSRFVAAGFLFGCLAPLASAQALVADLRPGPAIGVDPLHDVTPLASLGQVALFCATDIAHGRRLWRSDGTAGGTWMLPGGTSSGTSQAATVWNGAVYYGATDFAGTVGLWRSDGTAAGTTRRASVWHRRVHHTYT